MIKKARDTAIRIDDKLGAKELENVGAGHDSDWGLSNQLHRRLGHICPQVHQTQRGWVLGVGISRVGEEDLSRSDEFAAKYDEMVHVLVSRWHLGHVGVDRLSET